MDYLESIQSLAFDLVSKSRRGEPTESEYVYRQIYRWYSKTYSTALHLVEELPEFDILRAFYECRFENMDDQELEEVRLELIKTDKQREEEAKQRLLEEVDGWAMAKEEEGQVTNPIDKLAKEAEGFKTALNRFKDNLPKHMTKETTLDSGVKTNLPPNIKMEFVDESELDLDSDSIGMLDTPKTR